VSAGFGASAVGSMTMGIRALSAEASPLPKVFKFVNFYKD